MTYNRRALSVDEILKFLDEDLSSDFESPYESSDDDTGKAVVTKTKTPENELPGPSEVQQSVSVVESESEVREVDNENNGPQTVRNFKKRDFISTVPAFTLPSGSVQQYFAGKDTATDIFLTVLSDKVIDKLVFQSNLYLIQKQKRIQPITEQDLYGFFGLDFLFSYHRLPQTRNYWCSDVDLNVPVVSHIMTRERYKQVLSVLHCNDNLSVPEDNKDRLYKLRPLITALNENFQKFRLPDQFQSIDESMVRFKGRSSLKQYNPMKPIKRGFKLWCRADMTGYIYEFDVYQGKTGNNNSKQFGLGGSVVQKLTSSLHNGNYIVMMDNFFSSLELFEYLKAHGVYACGTVRPNRVGLPRLVNDKDLGGRGEFDYEVSDQDIVYYKWKDNRCVHLLSNYHGTETVNVERKGKDGTKNEICAPTVVRDYNSHMGGVDKADMLRSLYDRDKKSKKWWHRLLFAFIDMTLVNSYVIYSEMHGKLPLLEYKRMVTQGLLTKATTCSKKRGRPKTNSSPLAASSCVHQKNKRRKAGFSVGKDIRTQNCGAHWPEFVKNRGRCELCAMRKLESRPHSKCSLCKVFLCVNEKKNCFREYHFA